MTFVRVFEYLEHMANENENGEPQTTDRRGLERVDGKLFYAGQALPDGPWNDEPDHVDFDAHGFACIIHRGPLGALCGYVAVPPGHPWHGKSDSEIHSETGAYPQVHGGITYHRECQGPICHIPKPGEPDGVWWLGFDCNHLGDIAPGMIALEEQLAIKYGHPHRSMSPWGESYKQLSYVRRETEQLAMQAAEASVKGNLLRAWRPTDEVR